MLFRSMVQYAARLGGYGLQDAITDLVKGTWGAAAPPTGKLAAIQRVTQRAVSDRLILLAADKEAAPEVRAVADLWTEKLRATATAKAAAANGARVLDGLEVLVAQGAASFRLWTGLEPPVAAMRAAVGLEP